jgi:hypothetical protein
LPVIGVPFARFGRTSGDATFNVKRNRAAPRPPRRL